LSYDIEFTIKEALFPHRFGRTLLSFKDIHENNYHAETTEENEMKYLCTTSYLYGHEYILEKIECVPNGLYITSIRLIAANYFTGQKLVDSSIYVLWHDRLGHLG